MLSGGVPVQLVPVAQEPLVAPSQVAADAAGTTINKAAKAGEWIRGFMAWALVMPFNHQSGAVTSKSHLAVFLSDQFAVGGDDIWMNVQRIMAGWP